MNSHHVPRSNASSPRIIRWISRMACVMGAACYAVQVLYVMPKRIGPPYAWLALVGFFLAVAFAVVFIVLDMAVSAMTAFAARGSQPWTMLLVRAAVQIVVAATPLIALALLVVVWARWLKG